ncbi:hypothetical protein GCM10007418_21390 [Halopseudomonas salina]|uniref:Uncharacterized protein n=1 Tax=Halopseudomonas salina TaxID=1323744 RepID=A0ABQ1PR51_9GAMM|nr:hypothetical protein GCM10007418_21390 [Halopseudomonas salina]
MARVDLCEHLFEIFIVDAGKGSLCQLSHAGLLPGSGGKVFGKTYQSQVACANVVKKAFRSIDVIRTLHLSTHPHRVVQLNLDGYRGAAGGYEKKGKSTDNGSCKGVRHG